MYIFMNTKDIPRKHRDILKTNLIHVVVRLMAQCLEHESEHSLACKLKTAGDAEYFGRTRITWQCSVDLPIGGNFALILET